jgi:predicted lipase
MDLYQREKRLSADNLSIYTVGSPRVGNPAFAYYVDSTGIPFSRSVHDRDIVPHLPPQSFGYLHPGVEAWDRDDSSKVRKYSLYTDSVQEKALIDVYPCRNLYFEYRNK